MARISTAYVSQYQLDRVKELTVYRSMKVTLTCNWNGVIEDRTISSVTWFTNSPWSTILSGPAISGFNTTVTVQAALPDLSIVKCQVTLSDGSIYNQNWRVRVADSPYYTDEAIPSQGPESVSA